MESETLQCASAQGFIVMDHGDVIALFVPLLVLLTKHV